MFWTATRSANISYIILGETHNKTHNKYEHILLSLPELCWRTDLISATL